jgi:hypothetical protein
LLATNVSHQYYLNQNHPFIKALLSHTHVLESSSINAHFRQFFVELDQFCFPLSIAVELPSIIARKKRRKISIKPRGKSDLQELRVKQKFLLDWLIQNGYIPKRQAMKLLLKKADFPSWLFRNNGS